MIRCQGQKPIEEFLYVYNTQVKLLNCAFISDIIIKFVI